MPVRDFKSLIVVVYLFEDCCEMWMHACVDEISFGGCGVRDCTSVRRTSHLERDRPRMLSPSLSAKRRPSLAHKNMAVVWVLFVVCRLFTCLGLGSILSIFYKEGFNFGI